MPTPSLSNLLRDTSFIGDRTYFEYERQLGEDVVIPWLESRLELTDRFVGDFGCHQGGLLEALRADGRVQRGLGFDTNEVNLEASPFEADDRFQLEHRDLLTLEPGEFRFDLILLCDVLEHIPEPELMMRIAHDNLAPGGRVLVTFPPYLSPFGGHQQLASNWLRVTPYAHYLPERAVLRLGKIKDSEYMSADDAVADMHAIRGTRLTLRKAESAFALSGLTTEASELYLLRPEYSVRYGLRARRNRLASVPGLREIVTMGAYYLLAA